MAAVAAALLAGTGVGALPAGAAAVHPPMPSGAPAVTLPKLPPIPLADTDGQPEASLYRQALALSAVGRRDTPLLDAIAANQASLDADAVVVREADRSEGRAQRAAAAAAASERAAASHYRSLARALQQSALDLYITGAGAAGPVVDLTSSTDVAWAQGLLDSTVSPTGVLAERSFHLGVRRRQAALAGREWAVAVRAAREARRAQSDERIVGIRLLAALEAVDAHTATAVAADHTLLATQAGQMLADPRALELTPRRPLPPPLPTTDVALTWAFAELGVAYLWGGTGVGGFDCSGLTQYVWQKAGVTIPRVAADQYAWTDPVPLSQLTPGDLVFYGTSYIHHVGIYIGDGPMINAPHTGTVVQVSSIWWSDLAGFGRVHADGTPVASHQAPSPADPVKSVVLVSKPVPSETAPPPGWKRHPHAPRRHPVAVSTTTVPRHRPRRPTSTTTTTTTVPAPATTTTAPPLRPPPVEVVVAVSSAASDRHGAYPARCREPGVLHAALQPASTAPESRPNAPQ